MDMMPSFHRERRPVVARGSLLMVARSHTLRCDAKQAERRFSDFDAFMATVPTFLIGEVLPHTIQKGVIPNYLDEPDADSIPVISTITIQNLTIQEPSGYVPREQYDTIGQAKLPGPGDVLLTMDGGTSIGKPALFDLDDPYIVDSHVGILRPEGLAPQILVYLLASPLGQLQFQRAESGASGQTTVTEEDLRRFRFPRVDSKTLTNAVERLHAERAKVAQAREELQARERVAWDGFDTELFRAARHARPDPVQCQPAAEPG